MLGHPCPEGWATDCSDPQDLSRAQPQGLACAQRAPGHGRRGLTGTPWEPRMQRPPPWPEAPRGPGLGPLPCPSHAWPTPGSQWVASGCRGSRRRSDKGVPTPLSNTSGRRAPGLGGGGKADMGCPMSPARPSPCAQGHGAEPLQADQGADPSSAAQPAEPGGAG